MDSDTTTAVVALALLGAGAWWLYERNKPTAEPPPREGKLGALCDLADVPSFCCDLGESAGIAAGSLCGSLAAGVKIWNTIKEPVANVLKGCANPISASALEAREKKNRQLNGACVAVVASRTDLCSLHSFRPIPWAKASSTQRQPGKAACIAYANGCAPLAFASQKSRCKAGTVFYAPGTTSKVVSGGSCEAKYDAAHGTTGGDQRGRRVAPSAGSLRLASSNAALNCLPDPLKGWCFGSTATADLGDHSHDPINPPPAGHARR